MAVSTHRWRPEIGVKSGYTMDKKYRKRNYSKEKNNCLIELKFENSSYFFGSKSPVHAIYKVSTLSTASMNRFYSKTQYSESSLIASIDQKLTKKLYVSEYVESKQIASLTKLNDSFVRGYILSEDKTFTEEAVSMLEILKVKLPPDVWNSCRLIITSKTFDIAADVLRNQESQPPSSNLKFSMKQIEDEGMEDEDDLDYDDGEDDFYGSQYDDDESKSTTTTLDEDAEEKLRNRVASSKFRDSRIILANRPKPMKPEIDPVEKCFLALTKMFEDNIFSAAKGLSEVNIEIMNMTKMSNDSFERHSNESIDINFHIK